MLLRSIVGVQVVQSGTVTMLGIEAGSAALRHRVGHVTQDPVATDPQDAACAGGELLIIGAWIVGAVVLGSVTLLRRTP